MNGRVRNELAGGETTKGPHFFPQKKKKKMTGATIKGGVF